MKKFPDYGQDAVHTRVRVAVKDMAEDPGIGGPDADDIVERLQRALAECEDPECEICGRIVCPYGEPLHFHHDGCPMCSQEDE